MGEIGDACGAFNQANSDPMHVNWKDFDEFSSKHEFLEIRTRELTSMIERVESKIPKERIYEAAMKWIKHSQRNRLSKLPELLKKIKLSSLSIEYLVNVVSNENLITQSTECLIMLEEAKISQTAARNTLIKNFETARNNRFEGMYVACGSNEKFRTLRNSVMFYENNQWMEITTMLKEKLFYSGILMNDKIYIIGGMIEGEITPSIEIYDTLRNEWSEGKPMSKGKKFAGVASLNSCIYVCGGVESRSAVKSVQCYSESSSKWKKLAPLIEERSHFTAVALNGCIFAIGGRQDHPMRSCEMYSPTQDKWTSIKPMRAARFASGTATFNGKIYACGGKVSLSPTNMCEVYDPETDSWEPIAPMKEVRSHFPLAVCNGKLYAVGGQKGGEFLSSVEEYCPERNEWTYVTSLPAPVCNAIAVTASR